MRWPARGLFAVAPDDRAAEGRAAISFQSHRPRLRLPRAVLGTAGTRRGPGDDRENDRQRIQRRTATGRFGYRVAGSGTTLWQGPGVHTESANVDYNFKAGHCTAQMVSRSAAHRASVFRES